MSTSTIHSLHRVALSAVMLAIAGVGGCSSGGQLAVRNAIDPTIELTGNFTTSVYGYEDPNTMHVLMIEGDIAAPTQIVHVRMFWKPKAGWTPFDQNATNASVRYIVFAGEQVGVYSGAGFLFLKSKYGGPRLVAELRNTSLRLQDQTAGFEDRLGLARADGAFAAIRDDALAQRLLRRTQIHLRNHLGYPRFVLAR